MSKRSPKNARLRRGKTRFTNDQRSTRGRSGFRPKRNRKQQGFATRSVHQKLTPNFLKFEIINKALLYLFVSDTYIKTYLKDNDRSLQKRKTKVVSHSANPVFHQTLKYSACDVFGRTLMVMLWERQKRFDHNQGLGVAELALDKLQLTQLTIGWYSLFPIQKVDSDSYNSP